MYTSTIVQINCDEYNYESYPGRWIIYGVSDAYYYKECTVQKKDREYPKIINLACSKTDLFYERKNMICKDGCILYFYFIFTNVCLY